MIKTTAIKPLTDFLRNSKSHIQTLKETREPEVLTVNGEAAVVVQDAASYQEMAALAEQARQDARLQAALSHFRSGGKGRKAADVFKRMEKKHL
jgi:PHD/YefM family antitoxin component YafN of YafNO toxin-antitoxin module